MDKKSLQNMEQHITILGWLYVGMNILMVLVAALMFFFMIGTGIVSGDAEAMAITTLVGFGVSTFLLVMAAPGFLAGYGLLKQKSWARPLSFVLAALNLFSFPFGTAVAVYTFWVMMQDEVIVRFTPEKQLAY